MMSASDPYEDFERQDYEDAEREKRYPVCDICGDRITDDYYYEVAGYRFHLGCAECHSTEDYVNKE